MAAVQHRSRHHHNPPPSNPFSDYSKHPPPPPPKSSKPSSKMPAAVSKSTTNDISDAVRDTVVIRGQSDSPRNRPTRSQTTVPPPGNSNSHTTHTRRSHSQDSGGIVEKSRHRRNNGKKGSQHADFIDRLDITGVGTMFHHDGPFDACAPSRNRQRNMAPIHSWSPTPDQDFAVARYGDSAYPGAHAYSAFSDDYPETPKKKVDAIAEAWGMHEPEPYEEFLAGGGKVDTPASSIYNGRDSHGRSGRRGRDAKEEHPGDGHHVAAGSSRPRITSRRTVPPPEPILVPGPIDMGGEVSPGPGTPKRSKSLMQRIRRIRDSPNIPIGSDNEAPSAPNSPTEFAPNANRPSHRPQNSFLGRFGAGSKSNIVPPYSAGSEKPEPYVLIDAHNKQLPATPGPSSVDMGFDAAPALSYTDGNSPPPGGATLGRKTSLIQKVGRAVRGK